jgi:hypothetical protein
VIHNDFQSCVPAPFVRLLAVATIALLMLSGCVGGGTTAPPQPILPPAPPSSTITSVTVTPASVSILTKATQQFAANVQGTGSFTKSVSWSVNDVQGGNATVGTITSDGLYSAPTAVPNPSSVTVKAQSLEDGTKVGTAPVTIAPETVQINISPSSGSAQLGGTIQFMSTVTGTVNMGVIWSVNDIQGGQPATGTIDQTGLYAAPVNLPAHATVTVSATSQENSTKRAAAAVTILGTAGGITVTVTPENPNVVFDGTQSIQFSASVSGTTNTAVTWSVDSNSAGIGQISSTGLFTPASFNCSNFPGSGVIRAISAANTGAQGVAVVNLVPPTPVIAGLSPQPADAQSPVQISGTFGVGASLTVLYPGPNGTTIPGTVSTVAGNSVSGPVPLGASSGSLSVQQACSSPITGAEAPSQQSNSLPFRRLPRLRIRANSQVLAQGESTQMLAAFLGDPTPQPINWSALTGTITQSGIFTAGASDWDKVTGCISGTQQCDFFVFSVVPARIEPVVPVVQNGSTLQFSEIPSTLPPTWTIQAGGGSLNSSGLFTAPATPPDSGAILVSTGSATNVVGVTGGFPGMVNRIVDYPDVSAPASGTTTIPRSLAVDGAKVYVVSDNLPFSVANGHYDWIDVYDASDPAHPVWSSAIEGLDEDIDIQPMQTFASSGFLWRVTVPQITSPAGSLTTQVALFNASNGQPVLKYFFTMPRMWTYTFNKGLFIGVPSSFTNTGQPLWSSVTADVFDSRTGTVVPYQVALPLAKASTPISIVGIGATDTRIFFLFTQQQSDGSQPYLLSTYDFTNSPPSLLQTVSAQPGPFLLPGDSAVQIYSNMLFAGANLYDISSGVPVLTAPIQGSSPADMDGSLALTGPFPDDRYRLVDYSNPSSPQPMSLLYNGDATQGMARFVGNHGYLVGSGIQIQDLSAPGGPIPSPALLGNGSLAAISDLLLVSSTLFAAENSDIGTFVTSYDVGQSPGTKIGSFSLNNETPLSLAADGSYLFVGTSAELLVLDISNPGSLSEVASLALPVSSLALSGNTLFAGTTDNRLVVVDVTNPSAPASRASTNLPGFPVNMQLSTNLLFIAADTGGLLAYSIANPASPALLSQLKPSSAVEGVAIDSKLALLAAADGGFVAVDITNPAAPVVTGQVPLNVMSCFSDLDPDNPPGIVSVSINNGIAYVGSFAMSGRVFGFDYRQPAHPRVVSAAPYGGSIDESILTFAFSGRDMFVAGDFSLNLTDSIFVADSTNPRNVIRQMCLPPPFGGKTGATFPQAKRNVSGSSVWNVKARLTVPKSR